jgi:hypothetical protein
MKFTKSLILIVALVVSGRGIFIFIWLRGDHCDKVVAQTLSSPDDKWVATATQEECGGASGGIYYLVNLKGDDSETTVLDIAPIDSNAFQMKWSDSHSLAIYYPGAREINSKLDSYRDLKFVYVDTHNVKNH